jgi:glycine C-acetyltransferase
MFESAKPIYQKLLAEIDEAGLTKRERIIQSPQGAMIEAKPGGEVLNFCANNYLGLANHPDVVAAGQKALAEFGYGLSSVRFICGTQSRTRSSPTRSTTLRSSTGSASARPSASVTRTAT